MISVLRDRYFSIGAQVMRPDAAAIRLVQRERG